LAGLVDGDHYFDTIADDAEFEFRYIFPGWPQTLNDREALMALYAGCGNNIVLHGADALVIHRSQDPRVVIIEYELSHKMNLAAALQDVDALLRGDYRVTVEIRGALLERKVLLRYRDGCRAMYASPKHCAHGESVALKH
jgi:hypothetical protein